MVLVWRTWDDVNFSWDEVRLVEIPRSIHCLQISPTEKKVIRGFKRFSSDTLNMWRFSSADLRELRLRWSKIFLQY